jgi:hypothetical protein
MQEEYDALIANNTWHLVPPSSHKKLLTASGCIASRKRLMVLWIDTKHVLLPKGSNKGMA